jgi:hypothetical protein
MTRVCEPSRLAVVRCSLAEEESVRRRGSRMSGEHVEDEQPKLRETLVYMYLLSVHMSVSAKHARIV